MGQNFSKRKNNTSNADTRGLNSCRNCNAETQNNHYCPNCNHRQPHASEDFPSNNRDTQTNNGNNCIVYENRGYIINNPPNYYYPEPSQQYQSQYQQPQPQPHRQPQFRPQPFQQPQYQQQHQPYSQHYSQHQHQPQDRDIVMNSRLGTSRNEEMHRNSPFNATRIPALPPSPESLPSDSFIDNVNQDMYLNSCSAIPINGDNNELYNYHYQQPYELNLITPSPSPPLTTTPSSNISYHCEYVLSSSSDSPSTSSSNQRLHGSFASSSSIPIEKPNEYPSEGKKRVRFAV
ncbi:unnamed protein product [Cunninghamella blakesleeana]